ncbi:MAG: glycosyltransferase [Cognaticolwellia sp.]
MQKSSKSPYVVHLIPSLEVGGMERLVSDLAIARTSGKTSILCLHTLGALGEKIVPNVAIDVLNIPKNLLFASYVVFKALKKLSPDIIHCHNLQAHFFGSICALLLPNTHVVLTKHGQHIPRSGFTAKINELTLRNSKIIGVSADITQIMQKWIINNTRPIEYIANGISLAPYQNMTLKSAAKQQFGLKESSFCVGMVARLSHPKDHLILIKAIAVLAQTYPDIKLLIAGDGPLKDKIDAYIMENHFENIVIMLGERQDIANILNALDVFALTSSSEGIPMTILEAMAAHLPVVASNVGGIPQVVINGKTGMVINDKDTSGLVEAIRLLIEQPQLREKLGETGYKFLDSHYSINQVAAQYEKAYHDFAI